MISKSKIIIICLLILFTLILIESIAHSNEIAVAIDRVTEKGLWVCGKKLDKIEKRKYINILSKLIIENPYGVDPWGLTAVIWKESGFDYCAFGIGPRKWAYQFGLLKRRKLCISHPRQEILNVIYDKLAIDVFHYSGFDLGLCQILSKYGKPEILLSLESGFHICVKKMQGISIMYNTKKPWVYWQGNKRKKKYEKMIDNRIRRLKKK